MVSAKRILPSATFLLITVVFSLCPAAIWYVDGNVLSSGYGVDMGAYEFQNERPRFIIEQSCELTSWEAAATVDERRWSDDTIQNLRLRFYRVRIAPR